MKSFTLVLQSVVVLLVVEFAYGRIAISDISKYEKVAEIYSTIELDCDLNEKFGLKVNWRRVRNVRISKLKTILRNNIYKFIFEFLGIE